MSKVAAARDGDSCLADRALMIGAVMPGWRAHQAIARVAGFTSSSAPNLGKFGGGHRASSVGHSGPCT